MTRTHSVVGLLFSLVATAAAAATAPGIDLVIQRNATRAISVTFAVTAIDAGNQKNPNYTGTVHFASDDSTAALPPDYTFTAADAGMHQFSVTFNTANSEKDTTITVTDAGNGFSDTAAVYVTCEIHVTVMSTGPSCSREGTLTAMTDDPNDATFTYSWVIPGIVGGDTQRDPVRGCTGVAYGGVPPAYPQGTILSIADGHGTFCEGAMSQYDVTFVSEDGAPLSDILWHVENSTIIAGQGTSRVTIAATPPDVVVTFSVTAKTTHGCNVGRSSGTMFSAYGPEAVLTAPASVAPGVTYQASIAYTDGHELLGGVFWGVSAANVSASSQRATSADVTFTVPVGSVLPVDVYVSYGAKTTPRTCTQSAFVSIPNSAAGSPAPSAAIAAPPSVCPSATNVIASVPDAGAFAIYHWSILNGTITSGQSTRAVAFNAAAGGDVTLGVSVTANGQTSSGQTILPVRPPQAMISGGGNICAGESANVVATLSGTPPFNAMWSDGLVETNVNQLTIQRNVAPASTTAYTLTSFSDSSCSGTVSGNALVTPESAPDIVEQPHDQTVTPGTAPTLNVAASGGGILRYRWYLVTSGTMQPLDATQPLFNPGPLTETHSYLVRVSNACGSVDSQLATVTVSAAGPGRRRVSPH
jgi:hypothetical protein